MCFNYHTAQLSSTSEVYSPSEAEPILQSAPADYSQS